jgi:hypothetical protein
VDGGDPNNINKVLSEILKEWQNDGEEAVKIAATVPDGLRHFRNFAKKRRDGNNLNLLRHIYEFQQAQPEKTQTDFGLQALGQDHTEITECLKMAYSADNIQIRNSLVEKAGKSLNQTYKDQFYTRLMGELNEVTLKQIQFFRESKGSDELVDKPLGDLVNYFVSKDEKKYDKECQNLKRSLNLNESIYFAIVVRAYANAKNWPSVVQIMKEKK